MSSITTELAIASRDDLYRMIDQPGQRVVIKSVDWSFYEQLVDSITRERTFTSITIARISRSCLPALPTMTPRY